MPTPDKVIAEVAKALATATDQNALEVVLRAREVLEFELVTVSVSNAYCGRFHHRGQRCDANLATGCDVGAVPAFDSVKDAFLTRAVGMPAKPIHEVKPSKLAEQAKKSWLACWYTKFGDPSAPLRGKVIWQQYLGQSAKQASFSDDALRRWNKDRDLPQKTDRFGGAERWPEGWASLYEQMLDIHEIANDAADVGLYKPDNPPPGRGRGMTNHPIEAWWRALYEDACQTAKDPIDVVRVSRRLVGWVRRRSDWPHQTAPADLDNKALAFVAAHAVQVDIFLELLSKVHAQDPNKIASVVARAPNLNALREVLSEDRSASQTGVAGCEEGKDVYAYSIARARSITRSAVGEGDPDVIKHTQHFDPTDDPTFEAFARGTGLGTDEEEVADV